jgi:hypothetical protein
MAVALNLANNIRNTGLLNLSAIFSFGPYQYVPGDDAGRNYQE